jgi:hypothetical protein
LLSTDSNHGRKSTLEKKKKTVYIKITACTNSLHKKNFNQILVNEDSITKLTIATPFGNYSYRCMPFGIINGNSTFARAVYLAM